MNTPMRGKPRTLEATIFECLKKREEMVDERERTGERKKVQGFGYFIACNHIYPYVRNHRLLNHSQPQPQPYHFNFVTQRSLLHPLYRRPTNPRAPVSDG